MRNIEMKAAYPDLAKGAALARALEAQHRGRLRQTDTYFHARFGRLKLREIEGAEAELIAYRREDLARARLSDYEVAAIPDAEGMRRALARSLGIQVMVKKERDLWIWKHVRIHLDLVEHLGGFLEFEAVMEQGAGDEEGRGEVEGLMRHFGIRPRDVQTGSYADLLLGAAGPPESAR
jgi:predicted adenylyl cyclase CyaB